MKRLAIFYNKPVVAYKIDLADIDNNECGQL